MSSNEFGKPKLLSNPPRRTGQRKNHFVVSLFHFLDVHIDVASQDLSHGLAKLGAALRVPRPPVGGIELLQLRLQFRVLLWSGNTFFYGRQQKRKLVTKPEMRCNCNGRLQIMDRAIGESRKVRIGDGSMEIQIQLHFRIFCIEHCAESTRLHNGRMRNRKYGELLFLSAGSALGACYPEGSQYGANRAKRLDPRRPRSSVEAKDALHRGNHHDRKDGAHVANQPPRHSTLPFWRGILA